MASDDTKYADGKVPDAELKAIFVSENLEKSWRKKLADKKWLTVSLLANLGNATNDVVEAKLERMFPELKAITGESDEESTDKILMMAGIMGVIGTCKNRAVAAEARREKMMTDEGCTPQMGETQRSQARKRFMKSHPDDIVDDTSEPHDKFVDELLKGVGTHPNFVECYSVSKMFLSKEKLEEEHGIVKTLDKVLESTTRHKPKWCRSADEVLQKLGGFFIGLEYVNVCEHSKESGTRHYLRKLRAFDNEHDSLVMLLKLDWKCRKQIKEYQVRSEKEMSFSEALKLVLKDDFKDFIREVTCQKTIDDVKSAASPRVQQAAGSQGGPKATPTNIQELSNNAIKAEWARRMAARPDGDKGVGKGKGGKGGKGGRGKGGRGKGGFAARNQQAWKPHFDKKNKGGGKGESEKGSIPSREFQAMNALNQKGRCRYWNSSLGCQKGGNCGFKHECMQCGSRQHTLLYHLSGG